MSSRACLQRAMNSSRGVFLSWILYFRSVAISTGKPFLSMPMGYNTLKFLILAERATMSICAYCVSAPGCQGFPEGYGGGVSITKLRFLSVFGLNLKLSSIPHIRRTSSSRRGFQVVDSSLLGGAAVEGLVTRGCSPCVCKTHFSPY